MPGPDPFYQPKFRPKELEEAREVLRYRSSPHGVATRARLALLLADDPKLQSPDAGHVLGVHENTVRNWRKRWVDEGFSLRDKPHTGRPRFFPPSADHDRQEYRV